MWNICNILINTPATYVWKNRWNIVNIHLQHTCTLIVTYATSRSTFVISVWNTWNLPRKHLKHVLATWGGRGRAIPVVGVGAGAARAPPPPPSLAAPSLARRADSERDGRKRGGVGAVSVREGRCWRRPPRWRRPVGSGKRGGCGRTGCMLVVVEKENVCCVFLFFGETCNTSGC
jgi:hypothetical protein